MGNNQEHKIDKIFNNSIENQSVIPPADAWIAINTYTIGQEESKKRVWLIYTSLALLLLLFLGLGYYVKNQVSKKLFINTQTTVRETLNSRMKSKMTVLKMPSENAVRILNADSVKNSTQITLIEQKRLVVEDNLINEKIDFVEPACYFNENKIKKIENKPLILNDLSDKMQKKAESKIVALEESIVNRKKISKTDSVDCGSKFSLKHPIISLGFGNTFNFWKINEYYLGSSSFFKQSNYLNYKENDETQIRIGVSWKLSKKARFGFIISSNKITLKTPFVPQPIWSSSIGLLQPTANLVALNSDSFYQSNTVFGDVNIPIFYFKELSTLIPNKLDEIKDIVPFGSHIMTITSLSLTSQYDIISKNRKKGNRREYQLYGLTDFQIQRQTGYLYSSYNSNFSGSSLNTPVPLKFSLELNHLENASEFVLGLRAGLGFRYQFARKWDFYVEGSGQHSLNNWVKSDDIKTFQRTLSLQAGINLNL